MADPEMCEDGFFVAQSANLGKRLAALGATLHNYARDIKFQNIKYALL
jgi:hypothetical protein